MTKFALFQNGSERSSTRKRFPLFCDAPKNDISPVIPKYDSLPRRLDSNDFYHFVNQGDEKEEAQKFFFHDENDQKLLLDQIFSRFTILDEILHSKIATQKVFNVKECTMMGIETLFSFFLTKHPFQSRNDPWVITMEPMDVTTDHVREKQAEPFFEFYDSLTKDQVDRFRHRIQMMESEICMKPNRTVLEFSEELNLEKFPCIHSLFKMEYGQKKVFCKRSLQLAEKVEAHLRYFEQNPVEATYYCCKCIEAHIFEKNKHIFNSPNFWRACPFKPKSKFALDIRNFKHVETPKNPKVTMVNILREVAPCFVERVFFDIYSEKDRLSEEMCSVMESMKDLAVIVKKEMEMQLSNNPLWLPSKQAREKALLKVQKMKIIIGERPLVDQEIQVITSLLKENLLKGAKEESETSAWEWYVLFAKANMKYLLHNLDFHAQDKGWTGMTLFSNSPCYDNSLNEVYVPLMRLFSDYFKFTSIVNNSKDEEMMQITLLATFGGIFGHEIFHAIDYKCSFFDEHGVRHTTSWYTPEDFEAFHRLLYEPLTSLYNQYFIVMENQTHFMDGILTFEENLADLAGLQCAFCVLKRIFLEDDSNDEKKIQDFFISWAKGWKRPAPKSLHHVQKQLKQAHAPVVFRVNGTVAQLPAFYTAWNVAPISSSFITIW